MEENRHKGHFTAHQTLRSAVPLGSLCSPRQGRECGSCSRGNRGGCSGFRLCSPGWPLPQACPPAEGAFYNHLLILNSFKQNMEKADTPFRPAVPPPPLTVRGVVVLNTGHFMDQLFLSLGKHHAAQELHCVFVRSQQLYVPLPWQPMGFVPRGLVPNPWPHRGAGGGEQPTTVLTRTQLMK